MGEAWGIILLGTGFVVLLLTAWGLARARSSPSEKERSDELPGEPFAGNWKSFWLLTWLPGRYAPRGVLYGLLLACLSYLPLFTSSRWVPLVGFLMITLAIEYSIEGTWLAIQKRKVTRCLIGVFGLLLALASLGLNFGMLFGYKVSLSQILG